MRLTLAEKIEKIERIEKIGHASKSRQDDRIIERILNNRVKYRNFVLVLKTKNYAGALRQ